MCMHLFSCEWTYWCQIHVIPGNGLLLSCKKKRVTYNTIRPWWLTLHWRHNGHDGVSNHQPHDSLLNCLFRSRLKQTSKLCVIGLCAGNSPVTGEFTAQKASNAENGSVWWRHHDFRKWCIDTIKISSVRMVICCILPYSTLISTLTKKIILNPILFAVAYLVPTSSFEALYNCFMYPTEVRCWNMMFRMLNYQTFWKNPNWFDDVSYLGLFTTRVTMLSLKFHLLCGYFQ